MHYKYNKKAFFGKYLGMSLHANASYIQLQVISDYLKKYFFSSPKAKFIYLFLNLLLII